LRRFVQIALALWQVHSKKVLHRDIKLFNIFVAEGTADNICLTRLWSSPPYNSDAMYLVLVTVKMIRM
jgi:hypothetical protein